jgi:hypothetical protein
MDMIAPDTIAVERTTQQTRETHYRINAYPGQDMLTLRILPGDGESVEHVLQLSPGKLELLKPDGTLSFPLSRSTTFFLEVDEEYIWSLVLRNGDDSTALLMKLPAVAELEAQFLAFTLCGYVER